MTPVSVQYSLTESEFLAACQANASLQKFDTRTHLIEGILGILGGFVFLLFSINHLSIDWFVIGELFSISMSLASIGLGSLMLAWLSVRYFIWRKQFTDKAQYYAAVSMQFQAETIRIKTPVSESVLDWAYYRDYLESDDYVTLNATMGEFLVIPKAALEAQTDSVLALLQSKLKPND